MQAPQAFGSTQVWENLIHSINWDGYLDNNCARIYFQNFGYFWTWGGYLYFIWTQLLFGPSARNWIGPLGFFGSFSEIFWWQKMFTFYNTSELSISHIINHNQRISFCMFSECIVVAKNINLFQKQSANMIFEVRLKRAVLIKDTDIQIQIRRQTNFEPSDALKSYPSCGPYIELFWTHFIGTKYVSVHLDSKHFVF